jgi:hypothetical protein
MGYEYKIAFRVGDPTELEAILARLRVPPSGKGEQPEFTVSLEGDGFYFCDYTKSERSSCAFRKLIDEALNYSEVVIHEL